MTPGRAKLPVTVVSVENKCNPVTAQFEIILRDADGHLWKTDEMPCFWFDMEYAGKSNDSGNP